MCLTHKYTTFYGIFRSYQKPSIPLSFNLAVVLPRWNTYCVNCGTEGVSSSITSISSLIEPIKASRMPVAWSSNLGHRIPGVSKSSSSLFSLIHCFPLVTPGLLPVLAHALPAKLLINVDLPTLGIPTTIALTGLFLMPLFRSLSIFSRHASLTVPCIAFSPAPDLELTSRV